MTVRCNRIDVHVTVNLYNAMCRIRDQTRPTAIWADTLCINQADFEEKTTHVQLMGQIYARATDTVVHVGENSTGEARQAFSALTALCDFAETVGKNESIDENDLLGLFECLPGKVRDQPLRLPASMLHLLRLFIGFSSRNVSNVYGAYRRFSWPEIQVPMPFSCTVIYKPRNASSSKLCWHWSQPVSLALAYSVNGETCQICSVLFALRLSIETTTICSILSIYSRASKRQIRGRKCMVLLAS